jgi:hypothetical protein
MQKKMGFDGNDLIKQKEFLPSKTPADPETCIWLEKRSSRALLVSALGIRYTRHVLLMHVSLLLPQLL